MGTMLRERITGKLAWKGSELSKDDSWIYHLSNQTIEVLEKGLHHVERIGKEAPNFQKEDFPIFEIQDEISYFADELENGRGFLLIRGLPIERYTDEQISIIYYGLGLHLGIPVTQNAKGDLLGHVKKSTTTKEARVYQTNAHLPYHTDLSDVVGLLSLRKAKSGGLSSLASAASLYNELLENYPEYVGLLYRSFYIEHLGVENEQGTTPVFSYYDGKLSCRYMRKYIESAQEKMGQPLSEVEIEAFDIVDAILHDKDIRLDMMLEPGDIQFANNNAVLHSRTLFEDDEDPKKKRHLLRLWLTMPNSRKLAPDFSTRTGIKKTVGSHR